MSLSPSKLNTSMYGYLQGIAGKLLQEIEGLEFPALGVN